MSQPWDYIAKLVCIGDSGTGKSSLTIRLCEGRFSPQVSKSSEPAEQNLKLEDNPRSRPFPKSRIQSRKRDADP